MRFIRQLGSLALAICICALALALAIALFTAWDNWALLGYFTSSAFFDLVSAPSLAIAMASAFAIFSTLILLSISTVSQRVIRREGLWAHILLCGGLPFLILLFRPTQLEEPVILLAIGGMAAGACWWFVRRRQRVLADRYSRPPKTLWAIFSVAIVMTGLATAKAYSISADREKQDASPIPSSIGSWIIGGSATRNQLLLLNGQGRLLSYDRKSWHPTVLKESDVVDFRRTNDHLWVLFTRSTQSGAEQKEKPSPGRFVVENLLSGSSPALPPVDYPAGEQPIGLVMENGDPIILSPHAIYRGHAADASWHRITLSQPILEEGPASVSATLIAGNRLYVGLNAGEWGGGLVTIDLRSGKVELLDQRGGSEICDGPLGCAPVTGLVNDPYRSDCLLVSIGVSHMVTHGRILRICDRKMDVIFDRPIESPLTTAARKLREARTGERRGPMNSEAFFAMVSTPQKIVWAVGRYGLYRYDGKAWQRQQMPELRMQEGFRMSDKLPGLILLSTDRNAPVSLSGSTPMLVADSGT